jgi:predicted RNase H-like HicB family nuclease
MKTLAPTVGERGPSRACSAGSIPAANKYPVCIRWSDDDEAYIATVSILPGCMAHGETQEMAFLNAQFAIEDWLTVAKERGIHIP